MVKMPQIFPKWSNTLAKLLPLILLAKAVFLVFAVWYWFSPRHLDVGYQPEQPIPFSHKIHVDNLGMDCLYCHQQAEKSIHAGVPSTETCLNCHANLANKVSVNLRGVFDSEANNIPIAWKKIHKVPDFAYFPHNAHIEAGVGCMECHGQVNHMQIVRQVEPLSMGWCLDCHRNPAPHLRPKHEVTNMNYHQSEAYKIMAQERAKQLNPPIESCSGCHR